MPSIQVPALILWGEDDAWLPVALSERIAELVPEAQRLVIPRAGHFCMEDQPRLVASALRTFCAEVAARP